MPKQKGSLGSLCSLYSFRPNIAAISARLSTSVIAIPRPIIQLSALDPLNRDVDVRLARSARSGERKGRAGRDDDDLIE
ncbi:hypothetical protein [Achromobacter phage ewik_TL4]|nr:hypothetical protein [Achromobacter phage ewik_TL4]WOZ53339.1 hypothetical protein [Achromobacter phage tuull]